MLQDSRGGLKDVAFVDVFDGLGDDRRRDVGDGEFANGGKEIALEGPRRLRVAGVALFLLLQRQPVLGDRLERVVGAGRVSGPGDPAVGDRVLALQQEGFHLPRFDPGSGQAH